MRLLYCDPGLIGSYGHNATIARFMVNAFRSLGVETIVLANKAVDTTLAEATSAKGFFSLSPYASTSDDPLCGWLKTFTDVSSVFAADFQRIDGLQADDLIYFDTATPAPLMGLFAAIKFKFSPETCPRIVANLIEHPGLIAQWLPDGTRQLMVNNNSQALLYRYMGTSVPPEFSGKTRFTSIYPSLAEAYSELVLQQVFSVPHPYEAVTNCRKRSPGSALTVGFLGAQRENKGFHLVPGIVRKLLGEMPTIHIIVHNSWRHMEREMMELAEIARTEHRLDLISDTKTSEAWMALLDRCDLLVAPYDRGQYAITPSGVICEGLANAIPVAVPTKTALERELIEYGGPGVTFESITADGITAAVREAASRYPDLAERAVRASEFWRQRNGPQRLAQAILEVAS